MRRAPFRDRASPTLLTTLALSAALVGTVTHPHPAAAQDAVPIPLPEPDRVGELSVEGALAGRRSVRAFLPGPLPLGQAAQLLWAAQGVTEPMSEPDGWRWGRWGGGLRTAPSAGALYPLELYLLAAEIDGLVPGVYRYRPTEHALERVSGADRRALASAALGQRAIVDAPATVVLAGVYRRTAVKYGDRAHRYVHMEAGAAAENVYLQAEALGLGTVFIGAFRDDAVRGALGLDPDHAPLAILPVGRPAP